MANFIQRPRLSNPSAAYQTGALARNRFDAGQVANQTNAFNLEQAQQNAPAKREAMEIQVKQELQNLQGDQRKAAYEKAGMIGSAFDSFLQQPPEEQVRQYPMLRSTILQMGGDPNNWPDQFDPTKVRDNLFIANMFGKELEKGDFGKTPVYTEGEGGLGMGQLSSSGVFQPVKLPPGRRAADPTKFLNTGNQQIPYSARTGQRGKPIPMGLAPDKEPRYLAESEQQKGMGKGASNIAVEAFKRLPSIQRNINNLDRGLNAIKKGAKTGFIESMLPSFVSASIQLDQIQRELGLDIVGAVTFGALSEGELDLALKTALPTDLRPKELEKWLLAKRSAQQKMYKYIKEQATFLGKGGNTIADWYGKHAEPKYEEMTDDQIMEALK